MTFIKGDRVIAVDLDHWSRQFLKVGQEYTVERVSEDENELYVGVEGVNDRGTPVLFYARRFRPAPAKDTVIQAPGGPFTITKPTGHDGKADGGKRKWSLIMGGAGIALQAIVEVLELGAAKYAANAWQEVPDGYNRYKDALYRHMHSIEENGPYVRDAETGKLELAHVGCNVIFMIWYALKGKA